MFALSALGSIRDIEWRDRKAPAYHQIGPPGSVTANLRSWMRLCTGTRARRNDCVGWSVRQVLTPDDDAGCRAEPVRWLQ